MSSVRDQALNLSAAKPLSTNVYSKGSNETPTGSQGNNSGPILQSFDGSKKPNTSASKNPRRPSLHNKKKGEDQGLNQSAITNMEQQNNAAVNALSSSNFSKHNYHKPSTPETSRSNRTLCQDCSLCCKRSWRYMGCSKMCSMCRSQSQGHNKGSDDFEDIFYSSGESDVEFVAPFNDLSTDEKSQRLTFLWNRAYHRARGAFILIQKLRFVRQKKQLCGQMSQRDEVNSDDEDQIALRIASAKCIIFPENKFIQLWQLWMSILLLVVAIYVPIKVAFEDDSTALGITIDFFIDSFFLIDIIMTFFTAIERRGGSLETRHAVIARNYLKLWFWIDLFATMPLQILETEYFLKLQEQAENSGQLKILRLARLPRLWRIVRIVRLLRLFRLMKKSKVLRSIFEKLKVSSGVRQLLQIFITVFFLTHLAGCGWFLLAKIYDFDPATWVVSNGLINASIERQYLLSFYWAFQTLTTVGFGDISAGTNAERIFAIVWMIFGIGFYSFVIGNMTNLIATFDTENEELQQKVGVLKEFRKRTQMPARLFNKIKRHLENNSRAANNFASQDKLLNDLPQSLRSQIIACTHGEIIEKIDYFKDKQQDFLLAIMPELKPLKLLQGDILYQQKDHAEELYMIKQGKIKLYIDINEFLYPGMDDSIKEVGDNTEEDLTKNTRNIPFIGYIEGAYFGDVDIFRENVSHYERDSTAMAAIESHFFVLAREVIENLKTIFRKEFKEMEDLSKSRRRKHKRLVRELARKVLKIRREKGFGIDPSGNKEKEKDKKHQDHIDYQFELMMLDDFKVKSSDDGEEIESVEEQQDEDYDPYGAGSLDRNGAQNDLNSPLNQKREQLFQKQVAFLEESQQTLIRFSQNMQVLSNQAEMFQRMNEDLTTNSLTNVLESTKQLNITIEHVKNNADLNDQYLEALLNKD